MTRQRRTIIAVAVLAVVVLAGVAAVLVAVPGSTPSSALGAPRFVEETTTSGIAITYDGDYPYFTGGGLAVLDCDGDRRPDLFVAGGANDAALLRNGSPTGGALRFVPVEAPGLPVTGVLGAYPFDLDADGNPDLAVLSTDGTRLFHGTGDCAFEPADASLGFGPVDGWTTAFSATWEADAPLPTLAVGRYVTLDAAGNPAGCGDNALVRPDASGARYAPPVALAPGFCSLSMLFSDWDGSGRRDLRVTNDRQYYVDGSDQLWRVAPGEPPRLYTADDGWVSMQIWGMGIASQDVTGDGLPEVYLTSQGDNKLQTLLAGPAQPTYRDIALRRGVTAAQPYTGGDPLPSTAWHPEFADVNDDGFADLFVSKGNVSEMPDYATRDPSNLLLGQPDGTFVEGAEAAGVVTFDRARGASLADLNADGLPDLVVVSLGAPVRAWRNVGAGTADAPAPMGHWLALHPSQEGGNRDAIGAVVEVQVGDLTARRELVVGGGHLGGQLGWTHVGLGPATRARVRVTWPDGEVGPWIDVAADTFVDLPRDTGQAVPWTPLGMEADG